MVNKKAPSNLLKTIIANTLFETRKARNDLAICSNNADEKAL